jgi:hypothetical protein
MYFRLFSVIAVVLTINFALLPAAEAKGLSGSRATVHGTTDWFGAAMSWMADLLHPGHSGSVTGMNHQSAASGSGTGTAGGMKVNTGSCIDPMGTPHCTQ